MPDASNGLDLSRPWVAWSDESGEWRESNIDNMLTLQRRINDAWHNYSWPRRYVMGIDPATHFTFDERKPVGLSKEHVYRDSDGDTIQVSKNEDEPHPVIGVKDEFFAYIQPEYSIPLALNVLGYDRPELPASSFVSEVGNYTAGQTTPLGRHSRDALLADAIAKLQAVDAYDQREVAKKVEEEAAAKREAEYAKHKQESFDRAKKNYADAIAAQLTEGISAESAAKVQAALSAYETARRKLEGLPS